MDQKPFIIERTYEAPPEKVWSAITSKEEMKKWYFDLKEFRPEVGFEFHFWGEDGDLKFLHHCKITEVIPGKKLSHTWSYPEYKGSSLLTFELFPEGKGTKLRLTHAGLESFPQDHASFKKENFVAGWTEIIGKNLKEYLEGKK